MNDDVHMNFMTFILKANKGWFTDIHQLPCLC